MDALTGQPSAQTTGQQQSQPAQAAQTPANAAGNTQAPTGGAAPSNNDTAIFTNADAFKQAWDTYTASKGQPYQLIADPPMFELLQHMYKQSGGVSQMSRANPAVPVKESHYTQQQNLLIENIIRRTPIYESSYRAARILVEAELTQDQIQKIFQAVADGAKAGGNTNQAGDTISNRTMLGKGTDAINGAWNKVKTAISQSGPVSGFDMMFDKIQGGLLQAAGGKQGAVGKALEKYRNFAHQHPIMQGAIYSGLIALAGLSGAGLGGAAILGGIKVFDRLLQGDKASSALWKGFKTGAMAYGAGQLGQAMQGDVTTQDATTQPWGGQGIQASPNQFMPDVNLPDNNVQMPDLSNVPLPTTPYTVVPGDTLSQIAQTNHVSVEDMIKVNPQITNPDALQVGQKISIPSPTGADVYNNGVGTQADTLGKIATGQYTDSPISHRTIRESIRHPYVDWSRTTLNESTGTMMVCITEAGVQKVFRQIASEGIWDSVKGATKAIGGAVKSGWEGATNKITRDKLDLNWRKNYKEYDPTGGKGSVDSEIVKKFLRDQGVDDTLINKVFVDLKLDVDPVAAAGATTTNGDGAGGSFNPSNLRYSFDAFIQSGGRLDRGVYSQIAALLKSAGQQLLESIEYLKFRKAVYNRIK